MHKKGLQAIVLAAGRSTRFQTGNTKLLEQLCGQEMILYATTLLEKLHIATTLVVGYQAEKLQEVVKARHGNGITFVTQAEQRGTGHALLCTRDTWQQDNLLILNGDVPLIREQTLIDLYAKHKEENAAISFVTAHNADPSLGGYGRVVTTNGLTEIVEARDFTGDVHEHCCINAGIYLINRAFLEEAIDQLKQKDNSKELYITDLVKIASHSGQKVAMVDTAFDRVRGINTIYELWAAEQIKRAEIIRYWMDNGVRFAGAPNLHIDLNVRIGAGSSIGCGVHLLRGTIIGRNCVVHELTSLENATLQDNVTIFPHSIVKDSAIGTNSQIGPFAHILQNTIIESNAVIGNFIEVKRSRIGEGTKAKHLTYIGDSIIGKNVNVGAGVITCNYDGIKKHTTVVEDGCFIGSNNTLVAPITVGKNAFTAAGSVITEDVPEDALAVARSRQINKEGYAKKLREEHEVEKNEESGNVSVQDSFLGAKKTYVDSLINDTE